MLSQWLDNNGYRSRSVGTIHDAINLVVPEEEASVIIPKIREVMQTLPLYKMFGVNLTVPIVADVKIGRYWGDTMEIDNSISEDPAKMRAFINDHREELGL